MDPEFRLLGPLHEVACHFADRVDGSTEQLQATGRAQAQPATGVPPAAGSGDVPPPSPASHPQGPAG